METRKRLVGAIRLKVVSNEIVFDSVNSNVKQLLVKSTTLNYIGRSNFLILELELWTESIVMVQKF